MNEHEVRVEIHKILDAHDAALTAIRAAHQAVQVVWQQHDDALASAIEANRAAIRLLNRIANEGLTHNQEVSCR